MNKIENLLFFFFFYKLESKMSLFIKEFEEVEQDRVQSGARGPLLVFWLYKMCCLPVSTVSSNKQPPAGAMPPPVPRLLQSRNATWYAGTVGYGAVFSTAGKWKMLDYLCRIELSNHHLRSIKCCMSIFRTSRTRIWVNFYSWCEVSTFWIFSWVIYKYLRDKFFNSFLFHC